ncbi:MAG: hypothetical protein MPEBLZ_02144 [Candidatus Methanoperedens nitroreducens]|uniref:Uncharacterized protein n=1 Tax=Candidatus Methanoperedens nitratireducens TaxID=1392998 RepID=A0A0P8CJY9_9EURY|nr:hypothetical protein [Candidatus Methanoperedens sp. BLZ2]KAB2944682.1 MAG: hypothetical protein F9K14_13620 [Candidatus Methanoperedens sp.]KPQ43301.1 MAG: hypothetical protein MPEBLZ_02144 [Candidatus Methanoperedens sp. BLZ1]MBZ0175891.1 hypothetical protein [Candidatus Methanoperedens nitroreducens]CAG0981946.1 hypothetical protein METP2_02031 [Methanosarcinales archaeon]MCX9076403.1 hypothetical protein [Candidatus Methanoperedens sp.]
MDVIATTAIIGAILGFFSILWQIYTYLKEKEPIGNLAMNCQSNFLNGERYIIVTTKLENKSKSKFKVNIAQLFIDEGIGEKDLLSYPELRDTEKGHKDCKISEFAEKNYESIYPIHLLPKNYSDKFSKCVNLFYFSQQLSYIFPKQGYEETSIIFIPRDGFYRVMCIIKPNKGPCMCRSMIVPIIK